MSESIYESQDMSGKGVKVGSTSYMKYYDSQTNKWERVTGSRGAPVSYIIGSDDGLILESSSWTGSITLGANISITGSWFDAHDYASTCILVRSDVPGTLYFDHSIDGINIDRTMMFSITSDMINTGSYYVGSPRATYIRMRYTNGATSQTVFRLQTILYKTERSGIAFPLSTPLVDTNTIQPVKAVIAGKTTVGGGTYIDVKVSPSGAVQVGGTLDAIDGLNLTGSTTTLAVTGSSVVSGSVGITGSTVLDATFTIQDITVTMPISGSLTSVTNLPNVRLTGSTTTFPITGSINFICDTGSIFSVSHIENKIRVSSVPYTYDIAEDKVPNHSQLTKLGYNPDVDNLEEELWSVGGKYVFPTESGSMILQSTSDNDKTGSLGVQTLKIGYLDKNFVSQTETLSMNGTTPVTTVATDIYRVNSIRAITVGTSGSANGDITLSGSTDANIYRNMNARQTRGRSLIYTVPSGSTVYITSMNLSSVATAAGHFTIFTGRSNFDDTTYTKISFMQPFFEITLQDQAHHFEFPTPIKIPSTCDVVMSVMAEASNANTVCYGSWRGWIES